VSFDCASAVSGSVAAKAHTPLCRTRPILVPLTPRTGGSVRQPARIQGCKYMPFKA
jgi:hypothetical protein